MKLLESPALAALRERVRSMGREYVWVLAGALAAVLGGVVGVRLLTEFVPPAAFGEVSLGLTVSSVVNQGVFGPLAAGLSRFWMASREVHEGHAFWQTTWRLMRRWGAVALLLSFVAPVVLLAFDVHLDPRAYVIAVAFAFVSGVHTVLSSLQTAERDRRAAALHQLGFQLGRYLIAVGLVLVITRDAWVALLGFTVGTLLVVLSEWRMLRPKRPEAGAPPASGPQSWDARVTAYASPMVGWGVFSLLLYSSDRWSLGLFRSTSEVGIYGAVYQIGFYPVSLVVGTLTQFIAPILFQRAGDGSDAGRLRSVLRTNDKALALVTVCLAFGTLLSWLFADQIFWLLVAAEYRQGARWLPLATFAASLISIGQFLTHQWMLGSDTRVLFWPKVITSLVGVALFFGANWVWGGIGPTLWAWVAFAAIFLLSMIALRIWSGRDGNDKNVEPVPPPAAV